MCIPPFTEDPEDARPYFAQLRLLQEILADALATANCPCFPWACLTILKSPFRKARRKFAWAPHYSAPAPPSDASNPYLKRAVNSVKLFLPFHSAQARIQESHRRFSDVPVFRRSTAIPTHGIWFIWAAAPSAARRW